MQGQCFPAQKHPSSSGIYPDDTTSPQIAVAVTSIACPASILLNVLVIVALKTRKELKKNSNITFASLAAADLLGAAVSMPLSFSLYALFLQNHLVEDVFCTIIYINESLMYTASCASFFICL